MAADVLPLRPKGYYSLADLPQRESIASIARGTGWWELDQILKLYPGQFIVTTGIAGHGKSTFWLNVIAKCGDRARHAVLHVRARERAERARQAARDLGRTKPASTCSANGTNATCNRPIRRLSATTRST
jgi:predicted ATP-dependent serine protease